MWSIKEETPIGAVLENEIGIGIELVYGWEGDYKQALEKLMSKLNDNEEDAWKYRELNK